VEGRERAVEYYRPNTASAAPFGLWRDSITDKMTKAKIDARVGRLRGGNFGNSKPIGEGASEDRIDYGPGYRIYYGVYGDQIILLHGGDKSTQDADIPIALGYWRDYKKQVREHAAKSKL
jgi:putative addiction module killer protein